MKITFSEIRKKRYEKKNNEIFNLLKIRNDINGYNREIKYFRLPKKKNLKYDRMIHDIYNINDIGFTVIYRNMITSMDKDY